ncbi:hypothetical protein BIZ70_gp033 [Gordonia phage JSwag]|uniref:hypothetical protein n=1 Tax=Gordonia phage JSwag TaxID=1887649 RepID=UPI00084F03FA|nr:hypothetical protein BIZ70_gp033 [Gordonia phage JSwag]AOE44490.1 hypothetical protein SEA_JSWAG_80 [Gordonia phage JSwag]QLF84949.1 hypothetical protein SEA_EPSOCAMISIO_77 [Gordonia phage Epsocamisio]
MNVKELVNYLQANFHPADEIDRRNPDRVPELVPLEIDDISVDEVTGGVIIS